MNSLSTNSNTYLLLRFNIALDLLSAASSGSLAFGGSGLWGPLNYYWFPMFRYNEILHGYGNVSI